MKNNRPQFATRNSQLIILLTLFAFALRLARLDFQPLWGDEGWSFYFAAMPLAEMPGMTAINIHPPLYYALLHGWFALTSPTPELARFVSVVCGALVVPVMYLLGRRLVNREGGLAAAAVVAVAPMAVYYSQEVRMYGLVTLLGLASTWLFVEALNGRRGAVWAYAVVTTLALYTMYYAVFVVIFHALYLLIKYRLRSPLLKAFVLIAALYLPWIVFAGRTLAAYVGHKVSVEQYLPLGPIAYAANYLAAFSLGHLSERWQPYRAAALLFGLVALAGAWHLHRRAGRQNAPLLLASLYLLVPLAGGWLVNLANPFTPRHFERTLLVAAPAWWLLVGAGLVWLRRCRPRLAALAAATLLAINAIGLVDFFTVPRYPDEDYRPLLAQVAARAAPNDVLLASYQWQLGYYQAYLPNPKPQIYAAPRWGVTWGTDAAAMRRDLSALLQRGTVWFPAHQTAGHLWEDRAEALLAEIGYPAALTWYNPTTKLSLVGPQSPTHPGPTVNFEQKLRADALLPDTTRFESGRGIIPLQINWTALAPLQEDYLITLKLVDSAGEIWAKRDTSPRAGQTRFTDLPAGQTLADRHGLLISAGTPPGVYALRLSLTSPRNARPLDIFDAAGQPQGVEAALMTVEVIPARSPLSVESLAAQTPANITFDHRLKLAGYSVATRTVKTGQILPVNLFWQSLAPNLPNLSTFVQLQDEQGQAVALTERPPVYPTSAWETGTLLRDLHPLRIPAALAPGTYRLAAGALLPDKTRLTTSAGSQVALGTVIVAGRPHTFEPPTPAFLQTARFGDGAVLVGYSLSPQIPRPGDSLELTLYWRVEAGFERPWAIFAHLVDGEGRIWGQRDQFPGDGEFPTTAWIPGEYITDARLLPLRPDIPPGQYFIEVGLYDPATFERVPLSTGGDAVVLETPLPVEGR